MSAGEPVPQMSVAVNNSPGKILSIDDLCEAGSARLSKVFREFFNSGTTDQRTLDENVTAFRKYYLRSRVLVDVSSLDPSTLCLGSRIRFPVCVAPAGLHGLVHPQGELATSRACAARMANMAISSYSNHDIDQIITAGASHTSYAIQLYTMADRGLQERIIRRAEAAGAKAIFLTGDSPVLGVRYNEWRNDFRVPSEFSLPILERDASMNQGQTHDSGFNSFNDMSQNWTRDIKWLRDRTRMEIWIKGVMTPEDVELAALHGCDGVVISNHGGRQLDGVPSTIDALAECAPVAKQLGLKVHVDGGFRRGSDVFIAIALGAECVWVGRPTIWGLAYDGQAGVEMMLDIFYEDFKRTMAMCGCASVDQIKPSCLSRMGLDGLLRRLT